MGKHYSGTHAFSTMQHGPGKVKGAGELSFGAGPGKAAKKTKPDQTDLGVNKDSGQNSYKPKGMDTYSKSRKI